MRWTFVIVAMLVVGGVVWAQPASQPATQPGGRGARAGGRGPAPLVPRDASLRSIWIAGDSTAASGARGWGAHLSDYIDTGKINILNGAVGGQSSRTFQSSGSWTRIMNGVKKDDLVLIQFGHNDITDVNTADPIRQRGVIQTLGEETIQSPTGDTVHTFGWYMRKMIRETQEKGATPIVLSMTVRNEWKDGKVERGAGEMARFAIQIAKTAKVRYVDLNSMAADAFEAMGAEKVMPLFSPDKTHTTVEGADFNARTIVAGLRGLKDSPVNEYLTEKGKALRTETKYNGE